MIIITSQTQSSNPISIPLHKLHKFAENKDKKTMKNQLKHDHEAAISARNELLVKHSNYAHADHLYQIYYSSEYTQNQDTVVFC